MRLPPSLLLSLRCSHPRFRRPRSRYTHGGALGAFRVKNKGKLRPHVPAIHAAVRRSPRTYLPPSTALFPGSLTRPHRALASPRGAREGGRWYASSGPACPIPKPVMRHMFTRLRHHCLAPPLCSPLALPLPRSTFCSLPTTAPGSFLLRFDSDKKVKIHKKEPLVPLS